MFGFTYNFGGHGEVIQNESFHSTIAQMRMKRATNKTERKKVKMTKAY